MNSLFESPSFVAMGGGDVDILTITVGIVGVGQVCSFEVENQTGGSSLTDFKIWLKDHPNGEWYSYLAGTDFDSTTNRNMLFATSSGPHEVAANSKAHCHFFFNGAYGIKFSGTAVGGNVKVRGHLRAA